MINVSHEPAPDLANRRKFLKLLAGTGVATAAAVATPAALAQQGGGTPNVGNQYKLIRKHENDHVAFILQALGANARPKPTFQNLTTTSIQQFFLLSASLESTGTGAGTGLGVYVNSQQILAAAASILAVEARHTGFVNSMLGVPMTQNVFGEERSFERGLYPDDVRAIGAPFIASLNGGPPITYAGTKSDANDIAILNFVLVLEYLEADFYNINVPLYFGN